MRYVGNEYNSATAGYNSATAGYNSATAGLRARDRGATTVLANADKAWHQAIAAIIDSLAAKPARFTSDDVRMAAERLGLGEPHHHNAYGAAVLAAARRGVIEQMAIPERSRRPEAHGRMLSAWRGLGALRVPGAIGSRASVVGHG